MLRRNLHSVSAFIEFAALAINVFITMVPSDQQCILLPCAHVLPRFGGHGTKGAETVLL